MKKLLFFVAASLFSTLALANTCPTSSDTNQADFCTTFYSAASCRCSERQGPPSICTDMHQLYNVLVSLFGSINVACSKQHETSVQKCIDAWQCYISGGTDSQGRLCSGTGKAC